MKGFIPRTALGLSLGLMSLAGCAYYREVVDPCWPQRYNAMTLTMFALLADVWREVSENDDVRCAILTGAEGNFCSGMDLRAMAGAGELCADQRCQVYLGQQAEYAAMSKAVMATADFQEGIASFIERRPAVFRGR